VVFRRVDEPPLRLDNDPDDIHSDGVQVYLRTARDGPVYGLLIVPGDENGGLRARGVSGTAGAPDQVQGMWRRTGSGYRLTFAWRIPEWQPRSADEVEFDLLINRMERDRLRRAGQLVWSGGGGWVYLRGDRQSPSAFGILELG
jgi:hypothetical protein